MPRAPRCLPEPIALSPALMRSSPLTTQRSADGVRAALTELAPLLDTMEIGPKARYGVELVCEEILTNLAKYGGVPAGTDPHLADIVTIELEAQGDHVTLTIADHTAPFSPFAAPQPEPNADVAQAQIGGLGLSLVRQTASSLSYDSSGGQNRLTAVFKAG